MKFGIEYPAAFHFHIRLVEYCHVNGLGFSSGSSLSTRNNGIIEITTFNQVVLKRELPVRAKNTNVRQGAIWL